MTRGDPTYAGPLDAIREARCYSCLGLHSRDTGVDNPLLGGPDGPRPGLTSAGPNTANGIARGSFEQVGNAHF